MKNLVLAGLLLFTSYSFAEESNYFDMDQLKSLKCTTFSGLNVHLQGAPSQDNPAVIQYFSHKKNYYVMMMSGEYSSEGGYLNLSLVDVKALMIGIPTSYTIELLGPVSQKERFYMSGRIFKSKVNMMVPIPVRTLSTPITCEIEFH